jgi:hypothetical protein
MIKEPRKSGSNSDQVMEVITAFLEVQGASSARIEDELQYARRLID